MDYLITADCPGNNRRNRIIITNMILLLMVLKSLISGVCALDVIGWFITNNECNESMTPDTFPFQYYTHIVVESTPIVSGNGTASCNTSDLFLKRFVELGKINEKKIIWRD